MTLCPSILASHAFVTSTTYGKMINTHPELRIRKEVGLKAAGIVAILILGLVSGMVHHHACASDYKACSYCHAGVQTAVLDLSGALVAATFAVVELVAPSRPSFLPGVVHFSRLVPRAPPVTTHRDMSSGGCVGFV